MHCRDNPAHREIIETTDDAVRVVESVAWPDKTAPDRLGLEVEAFPFIVRDGRPVGRLRLEGPGGVRAIAEAELPSGAPGRLTFEPGGQVEFSSCPRERLTTLIDEVGAVWAAFEDAFRDRGVELVPLGIDPWHENSDVPQQLDAGRYQSMERFFDAGWPAGATMMRNTCSIQVNLDAGSGSVRAERWAVANLLAPILVAMFATSPDSRFASRRSAVWREIDPSRTGVPQWSEIADADPMRDTVERVMGANVMYVARGETTHPVAPGVPFRDWMNGALAEFGPPTVPDLTTHMSTIFPEVRARKGVLELRSMDALPRGWWAVPAAFTSVVLYDDEVRGQALEMLGAHAADLGNLLVKAGRHGMGWAPLAATAAKLGRLVLDSSCRADHVAASEMEQLADYLDRYTMRCRAPSDDLLPLLDDPAALLEWVQSVA